MCQARWETNTLTHSHTHDNREDNLSAFWVSHHHTTDFLWRIWRAILLANTAVDFKVPALGQLWGENQKKNRYSIRKMVSTIHRDSIYFQLTTQLQFDSLFLSFHCGVSYKSVIFLSKFIEKKRDWTGERVTDTISSRVCVCVSQNGWEIGWLMILHWFEGI